MNKICTSIDQSKKLIELGIDISTADMYWATNTLPLMFFPLGDIDSDWDYAQENGILPAWSLTMLFNMLPKSAHLERGSSSELCRVTLPVELKCSDWYLNPIDALFEIVVWLKENGYE